MMAWMSGCRSREVNNPLFDLNFPFVLSPTEVGMNTCYFILPKRLPFFINDSIALAKSLANSPAISFVIVVVVFVDIGDSLAFFLSYRLIMDRVL